ncbi:MAG: LytTR family transcriptional regulator DNA-binding domain-containing protein [Butyrivibrio sp.]|uniref:LytTR family transcriptional regulator DNA-binding domain-containing protein n=1 Tax=Butyrivibrio sp. TaxID=28121 RepID=UPI0025D6B5CB|nr:LytTR family transcriptional regulator DNA-binding domain-containing protein [Butyrivibrio sp.]MCR5771097.1 LytTR family transcriptional regulator DNA-binding domain-containing protein [Butyrivibrio sp.]
MGVNKVIVYDPEKDMTGFIKNNVLPYIKFRYNSKYELIMCDNYTSISRNLESIDNRVDFCCFYMHDESELEIYSRIKKEYINLPILLCTYSKIDHNLFFKPGLIPEEYITIEKEVISEEEKMNDLEEALNNIREYLDNYQPDHIQEKKKSIQGRNDENDIFFIKGEEIISVESDTSSGQALQKIRTIRGEYPCKLSIAEIEKTYSTILFRCNRDVLINKSMIAGYNCSNYEILLNTGDDEYKIKASKEKFNQVLHAYKVFCR